MSKKERIIQMYAGGLRDSSVIAERIGTTSAAVRTVLSEHRRRRRVLSIINASPDALGADTHHMRLPVGIEDYAAKRGEAPTAVAQRLLRAIARDDLYRAVLDEE